MNDQERNLNSPVWILDFRFSIRNQASYKCVLVINLLYKNSLNFEAHSTSIYNCVLYIKDQMCFIIPIRQQDITDILLHPRNIKFLSQVLTIILYDFARSLPSHVLRIKSIDQNITDIFYNAKIREI